MAEFTLEANKREVGKQSQLTEIRSDSRVPAVIYGFSQEPISLDFDYNSLLKVLKEAGTSNLIKIKFDANEILVIAREYQQDPVSDRLIHVDFMAVDNKRKVSTKVPLEFIGMSKAVKEQGGQLDIKTRKVLVQCLPDKLPSVIQIDISIFTELGQKLIVKDLPVEDGVQIMNDPNEPVASVIVPKKMKIQETGTSTEAGTAAAEGEGAEGEAKEGEGAEGEAKEAEVKE